MVGFEWDSTQFHPPGGLNPLKKMIKKGKNSFPGGFVHLLTTIFHF